MSLLILYISDADYVPGKNLVEFDFDDIDVEFDFDDIDVEFDFDDIND